MSQREWLLSKSLLSPSQDSAWCQMMGGKRLFLLKDPTPVGEINMHVTGTSSVTGV